MSRFFSQKYSALEAYVPGEQPRDMKYIKLNTNESPFPPSKKTEEAVLAEAKKLNLYSDPESYELTSLTAELFGVGYDEILMTNGSDEILNFAFMAFCDSEHGIAFPDITYGFYPVFAALNGIPCKEIPLKDDFTVCPDDYVGIPENVVIANPNAPTGICLPLSEIERIVASDKNRVVIIDEAYVDFGAESAIGLIKKYDNLLVTGTFSKSRSLAGGRLGFGIGSEELIRDLKTVKYSTNPYNVNRMTSAAGIAAVRDNEYYMQNARTVIKNRAYTEEALRSLGFNVLESSANFVFAESPDISGEELYLSLKKKGILVRHFNKKRIENFNRITIGTLDEMKAFVRAVEEILKEKRK
ncbi:MAG: histidinol-phosphate transaminase [Clostridia bacterium]|nr:histidinol-phosphate transaminase [Clostridia bacterium]